MVNGQTLEHETRKTIASATTGSIEDHEALEAGEVVRERSEAVQDEVHELLADRVVTAKEVVGGAVIPEIRCSRWKTWRWVPVRTTSATIGSKSTIMHLGTS